MPSAVSSLTGTVQPDRMPVKCKCAAKHAFSYFCVKTFRHRTQHFVPSLHCWLKREPVIVIHMYLHLGLDSSNTFGACCSSHRIDLVLGAVLHPSFSQKLLGSIRVRQEGLTLEVASAQVTLKAMKVEVLQASEEQGSATAIEHGFGFSGAPPQNRCQHTATY